MGYVGVGVVSADPALELEDFGDGMVELSAFGVPASQNVQSVRVRQKGIDDWFELGVERVGDFAQSTGVGGVIRHESCSGRSDRRIAIRLL
ncbi:hypothetical protein, partial [Streptomyces mirabilis]|uniref:hypothetical protein n=1 Tax=Streptomyces mirabilis TaxID=68239 RepID=UPI0033BA2459